MKDKNTFIKKTQTKKNIYKKFVRVLLNRIVKTNKAEKRLRSDLNQIETSKPKQTNQGNSMSENPGSVPPPAPLLIVPPVIPSI